jgi:hypothetical protein
MSYSFIQTPASGSLTQSPVIFAVSSSTNVGDPNFQYIGELTIWSGSVAASASGELWTLAKYPSTDGYTGIFDVSRILNSTMTTLVQADSSSLKYFKMDSYPRYQSGSSYVTGSRITSSAYIGLDGYQIFPEPIGEQINQLTPHFPVLIDGPATQSIFIDNLGYGYFWNANGYDNVIAVNYTNQDNVTFTYTPIPTTSGNSNTIIRSFPIGPAEPEFPLSTIGLTSYTIQLRKVGAEIGVPLTFVVNCQQKYPNIRIKFKNRYGVFQYLNMDMINRKSMSSDKRTYQPQLGSWQGRTLSYNEYDTQTLNYIVDSKQNIICNTNWLEEEWNDILKQLLVSTEIYWCLENTNEVKPLTIVTSNIQFKTGVNDHLIQYSFEFQYGQGYKLIL